VKRGGKQSRGINEWGLRTHPLGSDLRRDPGGEIEGEVTDQIFLSWTVP